MSSGVNVLRTYTSPRMFRNSECCLRNCRSVLTVYSIKLLVPRQWFWWTIIINYQTDKGDLKRLSGKNATALVNVFKSDYVFIFIYSWFNLLQFVPIHWSYEQNCFYICHSNQTNGYKSNNNPSLFLNYSFDNKISMSKKLSVYKQTHFILYHFLLSWNFNVFYFLLTSS